MHSWERDCQLLAQLFGFVPLVTDESLEPAPHQSSSTPWTNGACWENHHRSLFLQLCDWHVRKMPSVDRLQPRAQYCRSQQHYHRSPGVTEIPISMQMYANVIRLMGFDPHSISGASLIIRKQRLRSPTACSEICERMAWCRGKGTPSTWMIIRLFNTILSC